jgi:hypothetical protein
VIAKALRPKFEAGELRGWVDEDGERMDAVRGGKTGKYDPKYLAPKFALEDEMGKRLLGAAPQVLAAMAATGEPHPSEERMHAILERVAFVLLCSPSVGLTCGRGMTPAGIAEGAAAYDVLRIARERRWYKPHASEIPTAAQLRGEARRAA